VQFRGWVYSRGVCAFRRSVAKSLAWPGYARGGVRVGLRRTLGLTSFGRWKSRVQQHLVHNGVRVWPLQGIATASIVLCMAYKGRVGGRSYIAQNSRNSIAVAWVMQMDWGNKGMMDAGRAECSRTSSITGLGVGLYTILPLPILYYEARVWPSHDIAIANARTLEKQSVAAPGQ